VAKHIQTPRNSLPANVGAAERLERSSHHILNASVAINPASITTLVQSIGLHQHRSALPPKVIDAANGVSDNPEAVSVGCDRPTLPLSRRSTSSGGPLRARVRPSADRTNPSQSHCQPGSRKAHIVAPRHPSVALGGRRNGLVLRRNLRDDPADPAPPWYGGPVWVSRQCSSVRSGNLSNSATSCWVRNVAVICVVASIPRRCVGATVSGPCRAGQARTRPCASTSRHP
jgi:hypothetical protein